jgi:hypothetical protein
MIAPATPAAAPIVTIALAGTHTAGRGTATFTESDLRNIAAAYDPGGDPAPLVIGQPALHDPAYGWVKGLQAVGKNLVATTENVCSKFAQSVRDGGFKRLAASFYSPTNRNNPRPGFWYLRHIGFHGGPRPGDQTSGSVSFAESDGDAITVTMDAPAPVRSFEAPPGYKILGDDLPLMQRAFELQAARPDLPFMAAIHQARQEVSFSEPPGSAAARQDATVIRARQIQVYFPHLSFAEALDRAANELVFAKYAK